MVTLETQQLIASLYVAAFGRAPDKGGLAYWMSQMDAGLSFDGVVGSFLNSPEIAVLYGQSASDETFLKNLYVNVLNRNPDDGGAQYWQGRLADLGSRTDLVKEILSSIRVSAGNDHQLLQNKIDTGLHFADSVSGYNQSYAKAILSYVTSDPSSVDMARSVNNYFDQPPAPAAPPVPSSSAPTIALHEDTGASASDGITKNGVIDVALPLDFQTWSYSVDGGQTWIAGTGTSFELSEGSYLAGTVQARYLDSNGIQSLIASTSNPLVIDQTGPAYLGFTTSTTTITSSFPFPGETTVGRLLVNFDESIYTGTTGNTGFGFVGGGGAGFVNKGVIDGVLTIDANYSLAGATLNLILPVGIVVDAAGNSSQALGAEAGVTFSLV